MKISRLFLLLAAVWFACLSGSAANAQTASLTTRPLLPDLARIVGRGTLVVAQLNRNVPPMFAKEESGKMAGFDIELARAMAKQLGVKLELRRTAETYDEVVSQVAADEADLGISFLSRTAHRAKYVLFSQPYATQNRSLLINRVKGLRFRRSCPSVAELLRTANYAHMLGLDAGSAIVKKVRELNPDAQLSEFKNSEDLHAAVLAGKVAISVQGELVARRFLSENPAARLRLRFCEVGRTQDQISVAVPPGRHDLLRWVNVFLLERGISFDASDLIAHEGPWNF